MNPPPSPCPPHQAPPPPCTGKTLHPLAFHRRSLPHLTCFCNPTTGPPVVLGTWYLVCGGNQSPRVLARTKTRTLKHKHACAYVIASGDTVNGGMFCESEKARVLEEKPSLVQRGGREGVGSSGKVPEKVPLALGAKGYSELPTSIAGDRAFWMACDKVLVQGRDWLVSGLQGERVGAEH